MAEVTRVGWHFNSAGVVGRRRAHYFVAGADAALCTKRVQADTAWDVAQHVGVVPLCGECRETIKRGAP